MNNILFTVFTFSPNVTVNTSIRTFAIDGITLCIVYTISATIPHAFSPEMSTKKMLLLKFSRKSGFGS